MFLSHTNASLSLSLCLSLLPSYSSPTPIALASFSKINKNIFLDEDQKNNDNKYSLY